jgi:histidinol dehydrogenase
MKILFYRSGREVGCGTTGSALDNVEPQVRRVIAAVRRDGDRALASYTKKFDGVSLSVKKMRLAPRLIAAQAAQVDAGFMQSLRAAIRNIRRFHQRQRARDWRVSQGRGLACGQVARPLDSVGIYVPGGKAAYPSSVLMNVIPAQIAGVARIVIVTPPRRLLTNPYVCAAIHELGVTEVYGVGGAQAIAALAYGTRSILRVDKIVGPGNVYVQCAKRLVYGTVDIDMIAGPSEVVVLADERANAEYIAADMVSQAEHDEEARAVCVTSSRRLAQEVLLALGRQAAAAPRARIIRQSLNDHGQIIVTRTLAEAIAVTNQLAPEHLEIMTKNPRAVLKKIRHAGSIFLGDYAPVPLGDFFAGPNHVLPTETTARFFSPLGVYDFVKFSGVTECSREALRRCGRQVMRLAAVEELPGHARAVEVRIGKK